MRATLSTFAALAALAPPLTACNGPSTSYQGASVYEYLPLDGDRAWEFIQCEPEDAGCTPDADFDILGAEKSPTTSNHANDEVVTIDYSKVDTGDLLFSIGWSSNSRSGIRIHDWASADGTTTTFETPVEVSEYAANKGDVFETDTDGVSFTSEYLGEESCPNHWVSDPYECIHFTISGGTGDEPFLGDWWFAQTYGAVKFLPEGTTAPWVLRCADWNDKIAC